MKKILVVGNSGGGGHISATNALARALGDKYEIHEDYSYDVMGIQFYNDLVRHEDFRLIELLTKGQQTAETLLVPCIVKPILAKKIFEIKPDLIVSVFPIANYHTWELARAADIPMLVLVTDLYCRHFFNHITHPGGNFKIGLPFDDLWIKNQINDKFTEDNFVITGFPLRHEFGLKTKELSSISTTVRKELHIEDGDKIILVMMGTQGGNIVAEIIKKLAESPSNYDQNIHVVALCSTNQELLNKLENECANPKNPKIIVHPLGPREGSYMAALMRMSTILISKPGGATVNEAIASELYTLYDGHANRALFWEKGNMEFAINHGFGEEIDPAHLINQVDNALNKDRVRVEECPGRQFDLRILYIITHLIEEYSPESKDWEKYRQSVDLLDSMKESVRISISTVTREIFSVVEKCKHIFDSHDDGAETLDVNAQRPE